MPHKRQSIRETWKLALEADTTNTQIEANRTYAVSKWPLINIMTGADQAVIEDNAHESKPRILDLILDLHVAGDDHDAQIDDYVQIIEDIIAANPSNALWSSIQFDAADEPESVGGETPYTKCRVHVMVRYEV